jgi:GTP-binding protein
MESERMRRQLLSQGIKDDSIPLDDEDANDTTRRVLSKTFLTDAEKRMLNWKRFSPDKAASHGMRFVGAYLDKCLPPRLGVPEVAFLGRSNVGKSSLLNRLATGGSIARVGKTPGATASVNLYALVNAKDSNRDILGLVDLPGFGYAKLSKDVQESVQAAAELYLSKRRELMLGILLVDIRRSSVSDLDRGVLAALYDMGVPVVVVATKVDKVSGTEREQCVLQIQQGLGLPENQPLCVSSVTGEGCRELWRIIMDGCETGVEEFRSKYDEVSPLVYDDDSIAFDDEADFVDNDELSYNQGYDWIHGNDAFILSDDVDDGSFAYDGEKAYSEVIVAEQEQNNVPLQETFKSLRKRAKEMERRGEL